MKKIESIQEAHPLKQGLKLRRYEQVIIGFCYSRGTSIKTRIETCDTDSLIVNEQIQEAHPLKQGLKLIKKFIFTTMKEIQEAHPLKQGLKHYVVHLILTQNRIIQEAHPLKQGLKHDSPVNSSSITVFKRHIH